MMTEGTVSGWSAECTDCPYTIEPAFGAPVYPSTESAEREPVDAWVRMHRRRFPEHRPRVAQFTRFTLTVTDQAPVAVWAALGLTLAEHERDPVAELLDTVRRVKNIVWQNFGIEPGIPLRALPAGTPAIGRWPCPDCGTTAARCQLYRVGGPEGRGGVFSYGYSPDVIGSIDVPREEWIPVR